MPIYMDRHDISDEVTAEILAQLHQQDLKIQKKFDCNGLTYWFDDKRKTAFCLIEAPDKESIVKMHNEAHGDVPNRIIEVDSAIVESFLGRIEDPEKSQNTTLNIINDPAFRTIMVVRLKRLNFKKFTSAVLNSRIVKRNKAISSTISNFEGRIVKQKLYYLLGSFRSVSQAVDCAQTISRDLGNPISSGIELKIGLSAGVPVTEKENLYEDTVKMAERLSDNAKDKIAVSAQVKDLYESENLNASLNTSRFQTFDHSDESFLNELMDFMEKKWQNNSLEHNDFTKKLGYSKSSLYRKFIKVLGIPLNTFVREYRLYKAIDILDHQAINISDVAFETGYSSPEYFSKCFLDTFGILPSKYVKQSSLRAAQTIGAKE